MANSAGAISMVSNPMKICFCTAFTTAMVELVPKEEGQGVLVAKVTAFKSITRSNKWESWNSSTGQSHTAFGTVIEY